MSVKRLVTFGEIMGRIEPEGFMRFRQGMPGNLKISFSGAEANVAISNQIMGGNSLFISSVPNNSIGMACIDSVRKFGVDTSFMLIGEGRLGLYFIESGANQRPSSVIYDREYSAISKTSVNQYDFSKAFSNASWFHITGITPAISQIAAEASIEAVKKAKEAGCSVSCDLNYRKKLWRWESKIPQRELAEKIMSKILPFVDLVIGNEEDAWDVLKIKAGSSDANSGKLEIEKYPEVARKIILRFPNVKKVAITLRESISASHNNWGAMLFDAKLNKEWFAPLSGKDYKPYEIKNIVDRVGGGDAFSAGLIYALMDDELSLSMQDSLSYAVATSCLCHSTLQDINFANREEIITLMKGDSTGRVKR